MPGLTVLPPRPAPDGVAASAVPDRPAGARGGRNGLRHIRRRAGLLLVVTALALAGVLGRLAYLQLKLHDHYSGLRERQTRGVVVREQPRMKIAFRNGELAAQSLTVPSVYVDPLLTPGTPDVARSLAVALGRDPAAILPLLDPRVPGDPDRVCRFRWLDRRVTAEAASRVRALRLPGVGFRTEYVRCYPSGSVAAQVLGGVGVDGNGLDGIELAGETHLRGSSESERVLRDARRKSIAVSSDLTRLRDDGGTLVLTLNRGVQWIVEEELDLAMAEHRPAWACAVVLDPATGDVLAMGNRPTFDPNDFGGADPATRRNRCVTDTYEPGSTMKPFVLAALLEEGLATLDEKVSCENGAWTVSGRTIHDHHPYGALSVRDVIVKSSNIGAVKLGLRLAEARGVAGLRRWIAAFGFGEETGIPLPGESAGMLAPLGRWSVYTTTSVPIGHEMAVTPLQLARAYAVIANGGYRVEPRIVRGALDGAGRLAWAPPSEEPRRVLRSSTVAQVRRTLETVVESGTGTRARLDGYAVAGKTGTTQRYNPATRRYDGGHIASFAAFAPADSPRLCVAVVVAEPRGGEYYGGRVTAPTVGRILDRSLRLLEVPPKEKTTAQATAR